MARPYGPLLYVEVLRIGLQPQDLEAIMREARDRDYKKYELRHSMFLKAVAARRATRERRFALAEDEYFDAAILLATGNASRKKFGCPHTKSRANCAILKGAGVMGSVSGDLKQAAY